jgi:hypothetical protein
MCRAKVGVCIPISIQISVIGAWKDERPSRADPDARRHRGAECERQD